MKYLSYQTYNDYIISHVIMLEQWWQGDDMSKETITSADFPPLFRSFPTTLKHVKQERKNIKSEYGEEVSN